MQPKKGTPEWKKARNARKRQRSADLLRLDEINKRRAAKVVEIER